MRIASGSPRRELYEELLIAGSDLELSYRVVFVVVVASDPCELFVEV